MELSKTQIDRLGERLKTGRFSEADLEALDRYRASHRDAYQKVVATLRDQFKRSPTGRPSKSTTSIVDEIEVAILQAEKQSKSQDLRSLKKKMIHNRKRIINLLNKSFSVLLEGENK